MGPEEERAIVLIAGAIGATVRLLRYPPKSAARGLSIVIAGVGLAYSASGYANGFLFRGDHTTLALVAFGLGVAGLSLVEGFLSVIERKKETLVEKTMERIVPAAAAPDEAPAAGETDNADAN